MYSGIGVPLRALAIYCAFSVAVFLLLPAGTAHAEDCQIDKAQQLFGSVPRPDSDIVEILSNCERLGSQDWRVFMLRGVIAREQGHLLTATTYLDKSHALASNEINPMLELAFTLELRSQWSKARVLFDRVVSLDPQSRAALLGLAQVARARYHFDEAEKIYDQLLQKDPADVDAQNGKAWIALARLKFNEARGDFGKVLAAHLDNYEARVGLVSIEGAWRYQLDVMGGVVHTVAGTAWSGSASLLVNLDPTSLLEVGTYHYSSELPAAQLVSQTALPSNDIRLGYYTRVPQDYNWSVTYDYRQHNALPTEHWLEASGGSYILDDYQWFAGVRQSFGAPEWNNRLWRLGLIAPVTDTWDASAIGYWEQHEIPTRGSTYAVVANVDRHGSDGSYVEFGAGYNPDYNNVDLHTRAVWPVGKGALLFSFEHVSVNHEILATVGWRMNWQ